MNFQTILVAAAGALLLAGCVANEDTDAGSAALASGARVGAGGVKVSFRRVTAEGLGDEIGTALVMDSRAGLRFEFALGGLPAGAHGLHVHDKGDCGPGMKDGKMAAGVAAGGHFDPAATGKHAGPFGDGHKGDLPLLDVDQDGNATGMVSALHLSLSNVRGHAIIIHANGDNFSDQPKPLGGGGERIACGVVPTAD